MKKIFFLVLARVFVCCFLFFNICLTSNDFVVIVYFPKESSKTTATYSIFVLTRRFLSLYCFNILINESYCLLVCYKVFDAV